MLGWLFRKGRSIIDSVPFILDSASVWAAPTQPNLHRSRREISRIVLVQRARNRAIEYQRILEFGSTSISSTAAFVSRSMLQENNTLKDALAALLSSQKEHIVALQHAISQNHVANNVPLPPDLHACNGQAHGDPHAKAK